jgi:carboxymethylenebutenolidase
MGNQGYGRRQTLWHHSPMSDASIEQVDRGSDGAMDMFMWQPADAETRPPRAAILVIQEIFGVGPYIRAVSQRLADAGYLIGAPDVFWRFAPHWAADHSEAGLTASFNAVQQLAAPTAIDDCAAAATHLATMPCIERVGVLGFCLGGTLAWGVAAQSNPDCCVSYYGSRVPAMLDVIDQVACPTLFHFGNRDAYIPNEGVDAVNAAIAGRPNFVLNVETAGHAFDNHESTMFYDESAAKAAWSKTMAFLAAHLPV